MDQEAHVLPLVSTSQCVMRAAPMSPSSATAARDTAGVWTEMDRRYLGPALNPAVHQCVRKPRDFDTGGPKNPASPNVPLRHVSSVGKSLLTAG